MAQVDLHVHSCFSDRPSEWFLQRIGTRESYVDPENVYRMAKANGMDFVTITDHNTIDGVLSLQKRHPDDVFTGVEVTTYFPEDGTKIHVLVWGLDRRQFTEIERIRPRIYALRQFLREEDLAHAVAHATFSINGKLSFEHFEKLLLLFNGFEVINGSRDKRGNDTVSGVIASLTPEKIEDLYARYFIEPWGENSAYKGKVAGSDDHSGLFVGKTFTTAAAQTPSEFIEKIKLCKTMAGGRSNDYRGLAFAIYKVAYDFSKTKAPLTKTLFGAINSLIFEEKPVDIQKRILLEGVKYSKASKDTALGGLIADLISKLQSKKILTIEEKLDIISETIEKAADDLLKNFFQKITSELKDFDIMALVKNASSFLPGVFLTLPFFSSMNLLNQSRRLIDTLEENYIYRGRPRAKKILWFTDTLLDLNGVCATLQEIGFITDARGLDLTIVTCLPPADNRPEKLPPHIINLSVIYEYTPDFFQSCTLRLPSVLTSMRLIHDAAPDEIYISTPGPVGLLGILASKLLHIPNVAIYHTDFSRQLHQILGDETVSKLTEDYVNWFYSMADSVSVPTKEYMRLLERRGIELSKMRRFKRGINPDVFAPHGTSESLKKYGIEKGITLIHSGRVSKEKNVDFLADVYEALVKNNPDVNLVFAGDGPHLEAMQHRFKKYSRVFFLGRVPRLSLVPLYSAAHVLVFPSITDTFGMVVLEAASCGLPALVSNFGGPQEIVVNEKTGFIAEADNLADWVEKLERMIALIKGYPHLYEDMRKNARQHAIQEYSWDAVLEDIFGQSHEMWEATKESGSASPRVDLSLEEIVG